MSVLELAAVVLAAALPVVLVLWIASTSTAPSSTTGDPVCAWCTHRDGDTCTNPAAPVGGRECGPVCIGRLPCDVRQERRPVC